MQVAEAKSSMSLSPRRVVPGGSDAEDASPQVPPEVAFVPQSDLDVQLFSAAKEGELEKVKKLLQSRANLHAQIKDECDPHMTPVHSAAFCGHRKVVDLLVENEADMEAKDKNQWTPLMYAAGKGHREVVDLLVEKEADMEAKDKNQWTPLMYAAGKGHREVVDLLVEKEADMEAKDKNQWTPLMYAAGKGHREVVDLLVEKEADMEAKDKNQWTPLMYAAGKGHREVVDLLVEKEADTEAKDKNQWTPLRVAAEFKEKHVVGMLLEKGANPTSQDQEGDIPLSLIIKNCPMGVEPLIVSWITKHNLWRLPLLVEIIRADNARCIVNMLEMWPQAGFFLNSSGDTVELNEANLPERLRVVLAFAFGTSDRRILEEGLLKFYEHNLFWTPKVPVTLKYLPGVTADDAVDEGFLQSLADCPHDGIFETEAVQAMVLAAWQQYRVHTLLEIMSCFLNVLCLCCASYGFRHEFAFATPCLYVVAVLYVKRFFDFVNPLRFQGFRLNRPYYFEEFRPYYFDKCADFLYLLAGAEAIVLKLGYPSHETEPWKPWMAAFAAFSWLRLLYSLRGETWMGPRLLPIVSAIQDTVAFFLLMALCLSATTHAYYALQIRDEPNPTYAAVMQVVRLGIFGDFDLFEFEGLDTTYRLMDDANESNEWEPVDPSPGPDYVYVHVLFYITGVGITVLLMNVLIGVLSSNYERYEDQSVGQFYRARVKMLVDLQLRPHTRSSFAVRRRVPCRWLFSCLFSCYGFCVRVFLCIFFSVCLFLASYVF